MNANARLCTIPYLYLAIGVLGVRNSQYSATSMSSNNETLHSARAWWWKQDEISLNCVLYCTLIWHSLTFAIQFSIVLNNWHINKCLWLFSCLLFYYKKEMHCLCQEIQRNVLILFNIAHKMVLYYKVFPWDWYQLRAHISSLLLRDIFCIKCLFFPVESVCFRSHFNIHPTINRVPLY